MRKRNRKAYTVTRTAVAAWAGFFAVSACTSAFSQTIYAEGDGSQTANAASPNQTYIIDGSDFGENAEAISGPITGDPTNSNAIADAYAGSGEQNSTTDFGGFGGNAIAGAGSNSTSTSSAYSEVTATAGYGSSDSPVYLGEGPYGPDYSPVAGGNGGNADIAAAAVDNGGQGATVSVTVQGGTGGGSVFGNGGNGGTATVNFPVTAVSYGGGSVVATLSASGGSAGSTDDDPDDYGTGLPASCSIPTAGTAQPMFLNNEVQANSTGNITTTQSVYGGSGNSNPWSDGSPGAPAGSTLDYNLISTGTCTFTTNATGGSGGDGGGGVLNSSPDSRLYGNGGSGAPAGAVTEISGEYLRSVTANANAYGGGAVAADGGIGELGYGTGGSGGFAFAVATSATGYAGAPATSNAYARGGDGGTGEWYDYGYGGIGGTADAMAKASSYSGTTSATAQGGAGGSAFGQEGDAVPAPGGSALAIAEADSIFVDENLTADATGGVGGQNENTGAYAVGGSATAIIVVGGIGNFEMYSPGLAESTPATASVSFDDGTLTLGTTTETITGTLSITVPQQVYINNGPSGYGLLIGDGINSGTLQLSTTGGNTTSLAAAGVNANSSLNIFSDSSSTTTIGTANVNGGSLNLTGIGTTTISSLALNAGTLGVDPSNATLSLTTITLGSNISYAGGSQIKINPGTASSVTFIDSGNLTRVSNGTLIIAASGGIADLGGSEKFLVTGTYPEGQDGIVNPSIVGQDTTNNNGYFLSYGSSGFVKATSGSATNINSASGEVYDAGTGSNTNTQSGNASVYALNAENQTIDTAGHTLTIGDGTAGDQAGVILNGGSIISSSGSGVLNFGNNEGVIYTSSAGTSSTPAISANIAGSDGATFFGPGTVYLTGTNTNLTGGINVNQGTVNVTSGANLGATGNTITLDGGTLQFATDFSTNTSNLPDPVVVNPSGGTLDTQSGTVTISGGVSGSGTLTKVGSGSLILTDGLTVGDGTSASIFGLDTAAGSTSIESSVTVNANSTLNLYTASTSTAAIGTGSTNNGTIDVTGPGATTIGGITGAGTVTIGDGINATTLQINTTGGAASSQSSVTVNANSTLDIYDDSTSTTTIGLASTTASFGSTCTNNGAISISGAGSATINGVAGTGSLVVGNGTYATAVLLSTTGGTTSSQSSFTVNANATLDSYTDYGSMVTFGNGNTNDGTLSVTGAGSNTIGNVSGTGALVVGDGTNAVTLNINTTNSSTTSEGSFNVKANSTLNLFTDGTSTTSIGTGNTNNGALNVTGGGAASVGGLNGAGSLTVGDGTSSTLLQLSHESGASSVGSLTINANSTLDITNNHIFINYGSGSDPMSTIYSYLKSGFNGNHWNGPGIVSSTAQSPTSGHYYGIGFSDGQDGVVSGLSSGQIELKYTLLGDANLDGVVNGSDYSILAANFGSGDTNWDQGNFLYTSAVNGSDYSALAANFGQGDSGADVAVSASDIAALDAFAAANDLPVPTIGAVPEPGSTTLLAAVTIAVLTRRRKRLNGKSRFYCC